MSNTEVKPSKVGKFLAFMHKDGTPLFLQFDSVGAADGKTSYWHRLGSKDPCYPVGYIESPYHPNKSNAEKLAESQPKGNPSANVHATDSKPESPLKGDAGH